MLQYNVHVHVHVELNVHVSVIVQWNLSIVDTIGTAQSVLIIEVSLFQT